MLIHSYSLIKVQLVSWAYRLHHYFITILFWNSLYCFFFLCKHLSALLGYLHYQAGFPCSSSKSSCSGSGIDALLSPSYEPALLPLPSSGHEHPSPQGSRAGSLPLHTKGESKQQVGPVGLVCVGSQAWQQLRLSGPAALVPQCGASQVEVMPCKHCSASPWALPSWQAPSHENDDGLLDLLTYSVCLIHFYLVSLLSRWF